MKHDVKDHLEVKYQTQHIINKVLIETKKKQIKLLWIETNSFLIFPLLYSFTSLSSFC